MKELKLPYVFILLLLRWSTSQQQKEVPKLNLKGFVLDRDGSIQMQNTQLMLQQETKGYIVT
jgi:hypothetical protein